MNNNFSIFRLCSAFVLITQPTTTRNDCARSHALQYQMRQMKVLSIIDDDPVMTCTFSAIVFTTLAQCLFSQKSELTSELLAWLILPFIFKATRTTARKNNTLPSVISLPVGTSPKHERVSTLSCWVVASCLSCVSFYKAEQGMIYSLVRSTTNDAKSLEIHKPY